MSDLDAAMAWLGLTLAAVAFACVFVIVMHEWWRSR